MVLGDDGDHPRIVGGAKAAQTAHENAQARGFARHERDARWGHRSSVAPGVRGPQQFLGGGSFLLLLFDYILAAISGGREFFVIII